MLSVTKLTVGKEAYYEQQVATGVDDYYAGRGESPGIWAGSGSKELGLASTIAHDAHNIVVVGIDDGDMARAVQRLREIGGGIVAIADRGVQAELPLPVAGLLSDAPLGEVVEESEG